MNAEAPPFTTATNPPAASARLTLETLMTDVAALAASLPEFQAGIASVVDHDALLRSAHAEPGVPRSLAIGLRIGNNISGASKTRAIESLSTAPSTFAGDLEITDDEKGLILTSPNGTRYRLAVANDGTLSTTPA